MRKVSALLRALVILSIGLGCAFGAPTAAAQSGRQRPKMKDFGDSLERLKWDEKRRAAVETRPPKGKEQKGGGEGDEGVEVVRVETSLVVCDVLVLDKQGRTVSGLTREDFVVSEDGRPQEVGTFALGDDTKVPRTIVLVIDYSGSQLPFIRMSVEAAKAIVDRLGPRDLLAVVTDDVELIVDFTADKKKLKKELDELVKSATEKTGLLARTFGRGRRLGRSAQFSALMATLNEAFREEDLRPLVIFQTDGDEVGFLREPIWRPSVPPGLPPDMHQQAVEGVQRGLKRMDENRREFSLRDIHAAAERARATIYTVIPGYKYVGLSLEEQLKKRGAANERLLAVWKPSAEWRRAAEERARRTPPEAVRHGLAQTEKIQQALIDLSELTGGWADFLEEPEQAGAIYERIFSDVNRRYVIGYQPTNKARDGSRRRVQIEVRGHPDYTVRGRKSYYAPGPDE
jgi:VWFA-related protein